MAKGRINPDFQAAPFLGESSHDPIEFVRRHNLVKYQLAKEKQKEQEENTAKGLEKLMLDLKGWEDQEGFKEIVSDHDRVIKGFLEFSKKGLNLTSPKTSKEIMAFKAIQDAQNKIMQKVDTWGQNKQSYDLVNEAIKQDAMRPEEDRRLDWEATRNNLMKAMKGVSILDRNMQPENILVVKPQIGDVHKYVADNLEFLPKPDVVTEPYTDPNTGQTVSRTREVENPEYEKKKELALRKLYQTAKEPIRNAVKQARERDKTLDVMNDEDYFVSMYDPQFKQKMVDKISGTGGGLSFNFLGQKTTMGPGVERDPLPYGDRTYSSPYEFTGAKPIKVNYGTEGSSIFMGNSWVPLTGGGDVEAELRFYDPTRDEFVFRTTQAGVAPFTMNNMTIAIPRSVLGDKADDLPIRMNGQVKKLKDIYGTKKQEKKKLPIVWSNQAPAKKTENFVEKR